MGAISPCNKSVVIGQIYDKGLQGRLKSVDDLGIHTIGICTGPLERVDDLGLYARDLHRTSFFLTKKS